MQSKPHQNKIIKIILVSLFITMSMSLCFNFVWAVGGSQGTDVSGSQGADVGGTSGTILKNPLGDDANDPKVLIGRVIGNILGYVGAVALLMFVVGGLMWMTSAGNEQRVKKGKDILTWATMGLVIIFTAYALLRFVFEVLIG